MKLSTTKITTALALSLALSTNVMAEPRSQGEQTNQVIGLSSGIIVGSVVAGPLGGFIAGLFGVMIADDINSDKQLAFARQSLQEKDQQLSVMQQNFKQAKERAQIQITAMDNALESNISEIESNIQFKTASYHLEEHYKSQLDLVVKTLQQNPKLAVSLSGFADKRGDSALNQALSEQRAITVKDYLINQGVKQEQIFTNSYGESSLVSRGEHFEDDFFDRRVMLKVSDNQPRMAATNQ